MKAIPTWNEVGDAVERMTRVDPSRERPTIEAAKQDGEFLCLAVHWKRHREIFPDGYYMGYVCVPAGHWSAGKHCGDLNIRCHSGLTYSEEYSKFRKGYPELLEGEYAWVIGYDCAHIGDDTADVQNLDYQKGELRAIVKQLETEEPMNPIRMDDYSENADEADEMRAAIDGCLEDMAVHVQDHGPHAALYGIALRLRRYADSEQAGYIDAIIGETE